MDERETTQKLFDAWNNRDWDTTSPVSHSGYRCQAYS